MLIYINVQFDNDDEWLSASLEDFQQASEWLDSMSFLFGHKASSTKSVDMNLIKECERKCK